MQPTPVKEEMTFDEWLTYDITRSWNSAPICHTHDSFPADDNRCVHYILVYKNLELADDMMDKFPPAYWRAHTRGLEWED
jgi:hypothetical protein